MRYPTLATSLQMASFLLDYVRDDDSVYRVLPNHEGVERYDLVEVTDD